MEVMWRVDAAGAAINAIAAAGNVILGLDLRGDDTPATEVPWSSYEPVPPIVDNVEEGRLAALSALERPALRELVNEGYDWVLITWQTAESSGTA
ncbi:MAG: hypothetical protein HKO63_04660 [Acidimicrobiia bacterium]|nr:hypothetical protein [Acidimicrobiia bacterium]NNL97477.1 hypothetical protein [Acidimicrobiia bacterium]